VGQGVLETGMIDWTRVAELRDEVGDDAFEEVVELFLEEVQEVAERLATPPATADQLAADLHFLKGSALNLGFTDLAALCAAGEARAQSGDAARVDIGAVLACHEASCRAFLAALDRRPAGG
jgi:HPt (histidine-containing phosphotransfer) domain-containing protein